DHLLLARPEGECHGRAVGSDVVEESLPETGPEIVLQADIADTLEPFGKGDLGTRLPPELHHQLAIAPELEAGRGNIGPGPVAMEQLLADLILETGDARGHRRGRDVEPARRRDQAAGFHHGEEGTQFVEIHGSSSVISNKIAENFRFSKLTSSAS